MGLDQTQNQYTNEEWRKRLAAGEFGHPPVGADTTSRLLALEHAVEQLTKAYRNLSDEVEYLSGRVAHLEDMTGYEL